MTESSNSTMEETRISSEERVTQLRDLIDTLRIAEEIAGKGYLISSSELADLMDINASAVTSRGDHWSWRNWVVSRVRREGNITFRDATESHCTPLSQLDGSGNLCIALFVKGSFPFGCGGMP